MYEFRIVSEDFREGTDAAGNPVVRTHYTFHVSDDGGASWVPSLHWQPVCTTPGLPKTYFIDRTIGRLKLGASREANGDSFLVLQDGHPAGFTKPRPGSRPGRAEVFQDDGPAKVELVQTHGGQKKPREVKKKWFAKLDGALLGDADGKPVEFPDERSARAATAIRAFCTSGKAGRVHHARERLMELVPGGTDYRVWACCETNGIRATVDGTEYAIAWAKDASGQWVAERFKPRPTAE